MTFDPLKIFAKKKSTEEKESTPSDAKEHLTEEIKARTTPVRDTHGKFISKKPAPAKTEEDKPIRQVQSEPAKKIAGEPKGPYIATFYSVEIRKYYEDGKWYFSIEDILPLGQKNPPLESLDKLKEKEEFNAVFEKVVKVIDNIPCSGAKGVVEIVNLTGASFPGPFSRWIEETATFPFEEPAPINPE